MRITVPLPQLAALAILGPIASPLWGQCEETPLLPSQPNADRIGTSVAIDGDLALVTEGSFGPFASVADHVVVLERNGGAWQRSAALPRPADYGPQDVFGKRVALSGTTAAVLLQRGLSFTEVHLFDLTSAGWSAGQVLLPSPGERLEGLALEGDRLAVGSPNTNAPLGEVYVYERTAGTWALDGTLQPETDPGVTYLGFGQALDISGDRLAIGTFPLGAAFQSGSAYVYERGLAGWAETGFLIPPTLSLADRFGMSVAIEGDWMLASAEKDFPGGSGIGAVHVFRRIGSDWVFHQSLLNSAGFPQNGSLIGNDMGARIAMDGGRAIASLTGQGAGNHGGGIQTWELVAGNWEETGVVRPSDPFPIDRFGTELALSGESILAARPSTSLTSKAYILENSLDCTYPIPLGLSICPVVPNSTGLRGQLTAMGHPGDVNGFLNFDAVDLPRFKIGMFLVSETPGLQQPFGSQGLLCLAGNIGRYNQSVMFSGSAGEFQFTAALTQLPTVPAHAVMPGETWIFQAWFRDENPMPTSNFTDAVAVTFD